MYRKCQKHFLCRVPANQYLIRASFYL
uniref:Uncharacterized protein n=1 Tax=Anguilla anguilla TaxID=7936 RepID=A0A0E9SFZ3_ANGAN